MSGLFVQLLLTALALAAIATAALSVRRPARPRLRGPYRALLAAGLAAGPALVLGAVADASPWRTLAVATILGVVVLGVAPSARSWRLSALLAGSMAITAGAAYLGAVLVWLVEADELDVADRVGGGVLWLLELLVLVLVLGRVRDLVDGPARPDGRRGTDLDRAVEGVPARRDEPFVSLHVLLHDEPPETVIDSLDRLVELEYDAFEVLVVVSGTADPEVWRPVERFCRNHEKLGFFHLEETPGGTVVALDVALDKVDPRTEIIGVVAPDVHVDPDFLSRCVPLFDDEELAFVQARHDLHDRRVDPSVRRLRHQSSSVVDVSRRPRDERGSVLRGGPTVLVRREAVVAVGGWVEWSVSADKVVGLRLGKRRRRIGPVIGAAAAAAVVLQVTAPVAAPSYDELIGSGDHGVAAARSAVRADDAAPSQFVRSPLSPLSPLSSLLSPSPTTSTPSPTVTLQPVAAATRPGAAATRPTRGPTATPTAVATPQPTTVPTAVPTPGHGRPTSLPPRTKKPH